MSHISVIRNLDNRQSKLRAPPYHIRYHKNEKMSQLFEKGFIFPRLILPSGVRKILKELHFRNWASIHQRTFQSSLYLGGMESHHSIREQLRATDTFIAPKMQTRNRYSSNSTSYPVCQYPPCEELVKQINYSHQPEFRWVNNDYSECFFTFIQSRIAITLHSFTYVMVSTCMYNWPFIPQALPSLFISISPGPCLTVVFLGVLLLPPGWAASSSQGYPQHICWYPFVHLGEEKHCESKVSCLRTQHNDPGQGSNPDHPIRSRPH